jgi:hypothetical protein
MLWNKNYIIFPIKLSIIINYTTQIYTMAWSRGFHATMELGGNPTSGAIKGIDYYPSPAWAFTLLYPSR